MKHTIILSAALLAFPVLATDKPPQTPPSSQEYNVDTKAQASAIAGAAAGAVSGSKSSSITGDSTASGIGVGGSSTGGYSAANGGGLTDNSRSGVYVLPPPVWTSVPAAAGCIATHSIAGSFLLGVVSGSKTSQASDPACVGIIMAKAAYDHCHFESEQMIMARVYETVFPGSPALPVVPGARNHTLAECEDMKRPRLVMTPTIAPVVHTPAPEVPARAPKVDRQ